MIIKWKGFQINEDNIPEPRPGVYLFTNTVNGKHYVGIGKNLQSRCSGHAKGQSCRTHFGNALRKYGISVFLLTPIYYFLSHDDRKYMYDVESRLIREFDSIDNGYNIIAHGSGPAGPIHAAIIKAALADPLVRAKLSTAKLGKKSSQETVEKLSLIVKALWADPDIHTKMSISMQGKIRSPEARANISAERIMRWKDPVYRAKACAGRKGRKCSPETRAKMSAKRLGKTHSLETRAKMSISALHRSIINKELAP